MMKVEIWSDIACPFCYIGKKRFEKALETFAHKEAIQIEWKSFLLDPNARYEPGKDIYEELAAKKGWTPDYARQVTTQVVGMAEGEGLHFDMDKVIPASTVDGHRLSHLAAQFGLQDQAEEQLFTAYFVDGKNIEDGNVLMEIGAQIGLDQEVVRQMLEGKAGIEEIRKDIIEAQNLGVRGVPFFVLDRKYAVSGAQPVEVFINSLHQAYQDYQKNETPQIIGNPKVDQACSPEDGCGV